MATLGDIRYFILDPAAATFDGTSWVFGTGDVAVVGEYSPASLVYPDTAGPTYAIFETGVTTLTAPDGTPAILTHLAYTVEDMVIDGAVQDAGFILLARLDSGHFVVFQQNPNGTADDFAGIRPDALRLSYVSPLSETEIWLAKAGIPGGFGGAAGAVCFAAGTLIATLRGPVAVEAIRPGDRVLTRDRGFRPLRWAGRQAVSAARLAAAERLRPVRIAAGALGPGVPARDLLVSPQHRMLLAGPEIAARFGTPEVLVAAKHLVGRPGITVEVPAGGIAYHHLLFDAHEVVLADGAWAESLYTGPMALKLMPAAQRAEILTLFPDLARGGPPHAAPARRFLTGAEARALHRARPAFA